MIDGLLDLYNDYCKLYEHFGDDEYRHIMKIALAKIEKAAEEIYPDHKKSKRSEKYAKLLKDQFPSFLKNHIIGREGTMVNVGP